MRGGKREIARGGALGAAWVERDVRRSHGRDADTEARPSVYSDQVKITISFCAVLRGNGAACDAISSRGNVNVIVAIRENWQPVLLRRSIRSLTETPSRMLSDAT
jgi:hypothetical protein